MQPHKLQKIGGDLFMISRTANWDKKLKERNKPGMGTVSRKYG